MKDKNLGRISYHVCLGSSLHSITCIRVCTSFVYRLLDDAEVGHRYVNTAIAVHYSHFYTVNTALLRYAGPPSDSYDGPHSA